MQDRRNFLKTAAAVSLVTIAGSSASFASENGKYTNIIFTEKNTGKWAGKEKSHVPQVTVTGNKVTVVTPHPMSKAHFIVRHTLVLEDGTFVGAKTFSADDKPESNYELPMDYKGKIIVTSFCNLHDLWIAETMI
ncbi:desulfoferrodoxin family protein [Desulfogranum japonicum]|uniref:desulfoferrodoxin family protein n=1 Tax=Desulfogranum japonicum TaxID=231447 RepID=UPI00048E0F01|nr:desulfoferrodoxin family protein [Desulfogranum japonicum]